jgi:hypothetical protein
MDSWSKMSKYKMTDRLVHNVCLPCDGCVCASSLLECLVPVTTTFWFYYRCALNLGFRGEGEAFFLLVRAAWRKANLKPAHLKGDGHS